MKLGFGSYRISHKSLEHKNALSKALDLGCSLIDTASHFTGGESEKLIGEVLKTKKIKPLVITKVGVTHEEGYSIHPDAIRESIEGSLKRLGVEKMDGVLLHNPEVYFKESKMNRNEFYQKLFGAFQTLEDITQEGKILSYGISSNNLISPLDDRDAVSIQKILELKNNFDFKKLKIIEFPLNLLELGALERQFDGRHLFEVAKDASLTTITNRPFNAMTGDGLLRLATYQEFHQIELDKESYLHEKLAPLMKAFEESREDEFDHFFDIPLMKQFSEIWDKQPTPDAVDQVYFQYIFPFIAQIYGRNLTAAESKSFYDLYEMSLNFSRFNMHHRALAFENKAIDMGLIRESNDSLVEKAIEKYASFGMDYIVCGMRKENYVEQLKNYF